MDHIPAAFTSPIGGPITFTASFIHCLETNELVMKEVNTVHSFDPLYRI